MWFSFEIVYFHFLMLLSVTHEFCSSGFHLEYVFSLSQPGADNYSTLFLCGWWVSMAMLFSLSQTGRYTCVNTGTHQTASIQRPLAIALACHGSGTTHVGFGRVAFMKRTPGQLRSERGRSYQNLWWSQIAWEYVMRVALVK